jgi:hypothetical protein
MKINLYFCDMEYKKVEEKHYENVKKVLSYSDDNIFFTEFYKLSFLEQKMILLTVYRNFKVNEPNSDRTMKLLKSDENRSVIDSNFVDLDTDEFIGFDKELISDENDDKFILSHKKLF